MVICDYYGIVWRESNIGFWANFQFQNHHPRYKITVSSLLKRLLFVNGSYMLLTILTMDWWYLTQRSCFIHLLIREKKTDCNQFIQTSIPNFRIISEGQKSYL